MDTTSRFRIDAYELGQKKKETQAPPKKKDSKMTCYKAVKQIPVSISLRCAEDQYLGLSYAQLIAVQFDDNADRQDIVLHFSTYEVTIRGVYLLPIYELLLERKVLWMRPVNMNYVRRMEKRKANNNYSKTAPIITAIGYIQKA
ncbi:MAG: hypothetical protein AAF731_04815 [Bacteroidota bacterium]